MNKKFLYIFFIVILIIVVVLSIVIYLRLHQKYGNDILCKIIGSVLSVLCVVSILGIVVCLIGIKRIK